MSDSLPSPLRVLITNRQALVAPVAHDALTARLIEEAGFRLYAIGGVAVAGFRYALPDCGILSFGEMLSAVADITKGSALPAMVDAEDGYGDGKRIARTVLTYQGAGVAAISIDDHGEPDPLDATKTVVALDAAVARIKTAVLARGDGPALIVARTGALPIQGLPAALLRAEALAAAGADLLFVDAPRTVEEVQAISARLVGVAPLVINMHGGPQTPSILPKELAAMGFTVILAPLAVMMGTILATQTALAGLGQGRYRGVPDGEPGPDLTSLLKLSDWTRYRGL